MSDLTDTILNLSVFAFLGVVVWLLIKPAKGLVMCDRQDK